MNTVFAAGQSLGTIGGEGLGPFAKSTNPAQNITTALSGVIGFMTVCAVLWFMVQFLMGGISWISAAGDKNKLGEARDRITNAFIGLLIVVSAWAILAIAGQFFGWTDILSPASMLEKIKFK